MSKRMEIPDEEMLADLTREAHETIKDLRQATREAREVVAEARHVRSGFDKFVEDLSADMQGAYDDAIEVTRKQLEKTSEHYFAEFVRLTKEHATNSAGPIDRAERLRQQMEWRERATGILEDPGLPRPVTPEQIAVADRAEAAFLEMKARIEDYDKVPRDLDNPQPSIIAIYGRLMHGIRFGTFQKCPHIDLSNPAPWFANAWTDFISCARCYLAMCGDMSDEERYTCDLCGEYQEGGLYDDKTIIGSLCLSYGTCDDCDPQPHMRPSSKAV